MTDRTKTICPPIFDHGGIKSGVIALNKKVKASEFPLAKLSYSVLVINSLR
jgi:hypothetical protein